MALVSLVAQLPRDPRAAIAAWIADGPLTAYGCVFLIIFIETGVVFFPFLPGDSLLFAAGFFAQGGGFNIVALLAVAWAAAILGDQRWRNFVLFNVLGGVAWSTLSTLLGYLFGGVGFVRDHFKMLIAAIVAVSVVPTLAGLVKSRLPRRRLARGSDARHPKPLRTHVSKALHDAACVRPIASLYASSVLQYAQALLGQRSKMLTRWHQTAAICFVTYPFTSQMQPFAVCIEIARPYLRIGGQYCYRSARPPERSSPLRSSGSQFGRFAIARPTVRQRFFQPPVLWEDARGT